MKIHWKHKNIILFGTGILVAFLISKVPGFRELLLKIRDFGYFGAFLAGILFTSTFTVVAGALILIDLAREFPIFPLILCSGLGAVLSDFLVFSFAKNKITGEVEPLYKELESIGKKNHLQKLMHTKYFGWTLPVVGAFIMASPLPDELGVSLLGISNIKPVRFLLISLCSHSLGMFLLVSAAALM